MIRLRHKRLHHSTIMGRSHHNPSYYSDNIHIKIAKIILKEVSSFRENLRKKFIL